MYILFQIKRMKYTRKINEMALYYFFSFKLI